MGNSVLIRNSKQLFITKEEKKMELPWRLAYLVIKSLNEKHNIGLTDKEIMDLLDMETVKEPKET